MSNETKVKIIKNVACILGAVLILILFFIFSRGTSLLEGLSSYLPFIMIEMVIGVFSFYWSISRVNKQNLINMLSILGTLVSALLYIVFASVCAVAFAAKGEPAMPIQMAAFIFFVLSWIGIAYCLFCPIYIDFISDKVAKKAAVSK